MNLYIPAIIFFWTWHLQHLNTATFCNLQFTLFLWCLLTSHFIFDSTHQEMNSYQCLTNKQKQRLLAMGIVSNRYLQLEPESIVSDVLQYYWKLSIQTPNGYSSLVFYVLAIDAIWYLPCIYKRIILHVKLCKCLMHCWKNRQTAANIKKHKINSFFSIF